MDTDSPTVKQVKILLNVARLTELAAQLRDVEVYLYGSAARGEDTPRSDIDILIVGKPEPRLIACLGYRERAHCAIGVVLEHLHRTRCLEAYFVDDFKGAKFAREEADYKASYSRERQSSC